MFKNLRNELRELYNKQNVKKENYVYINNCSDIFKKIIFNDDDKIVDTLKQNNCLCDEPKIYQIKNKIIDLNNTFSFYDIKNEDVIYMLPPPAPLPYLIYLHLEKTGKVYCVELNHTDSIECLQKHIEKRLNVKIEHQILIYEGKTLNNEKTLQEENLNRESLVLVIDKKDIPKIEDEDRNLDIEV